MNSSGITRPWKRSKRVFPRRASPSIRRTPDPQAARAWVRSFEPWPPAQTVLVVPVIDQRAARLTDACERHNATVGVHPKAIVR